VPPVQPREVIDPTGCCDAWRGALLFGLEQGWSLERCARLGNQVGAIKIASRGPQNYTLDPLRPDAPLAAVPAAQPPR
jgi:adenosine kinase